MKRKLFLLFLISVLAVTLAACGNRHKISVAGDESLVVSCPTSAKAGETVVVETCDVTDGWLEMKTNADVAVEPAKGGFQFVMPDQPVEVRVVFVSDEFGGA